MFTINKGNLEKYTGTQEHVTVPDEVTVISDYGFYGAKNMKTITIPDTVKEIGNNAFYDCEELEEIVLPDSVSYIGSPYWTGKNALSHFVTKANFEGDNALVPLHIIEKHKNEAEN